MFKKGVRVRVHRLCNDRHEFLELRVSPELRDIGHLQFFELEVVPIESLIEFMLADSLAAFRSIAVPFRKVIDEQVLDQRFGRLAEIFREEHFAVEYILVDDKGVLVRERVNTDHQLVDQHPEGPPVHGRGMADIADDLGGEVFGGAAEGVGAILDHF